MHYIHSRFRVMTASTVIVCVLLWFFSINGTATIFAVKTAQDQDIVAPASKIDKPVIRSLKIVPGTLNANGVNSLKFRLRFSDGGGNLKGGVFELTLTESNNHSHTISFDLNSKKFKRLNGKYAFTKDLLLGNCKSVDIVARLTDSTKLKSKKRSFTIVTTGYVDVGDDSGPAWGTKYGQRAENFTLFDKDGNQVSLHDYVGKVILLDLSTMWCGPCQSEASDAEALYQEYKDQGLIILSVLFQDYSGLPATMDDCKTWADLYGLTFPVLADTYAEVWNLYDDEGYIPLNLIIDKKMVIQYKGAGYGENIGEYFRQKIEELLAK